MKQKNTTSTFTEEELALRRDRVLSISSRIEKGTYFTDRDIDKVSDVLAEVFMDEYFDGI